jgi:hypothetical protein
LWNPSFKIPKNKLKLVFLFDELGHKFYIYVRRVSASLNSNVIITPKIVRESAQCL